MVKPIDEESIAMEKIFCYSSQKKGTPCHSLQDYEKKNNKVWSGDRRSDRKEWPESLLLLFMAKNRAKQNRKVSKLGLYSLNNFGRF